MLSHEISQLCLFPVERRDADELLNAFEAFSRCLFDQPRDVFPGERVEDARGIARNLRLGFIDPSDGLGLAVLPFDQKIGLGSLGMDECRNPTLAVERFFLQRASCAVEQELQCVRDRGFARTVLTVNDGKVPFGIKLQREGLVSSPEGFNRELHRHLLSPALSAC